jgi:ribosomal protein L2
MASKGGKMNDLEQKVYEYPPNSYSREEAFKLIGIFETEYGKYMPAVMSSIEYDKSNKALIALLSGDTNKFLINLCLGLFADDDYGSNPSLRLIFNEPLENVPLYINNPKKYLQAIARWRLAIGR